jgi:hypothetical protein
MISCSVTSDQDPIKPIRDGATLDVFSATFDLARLLQEQTSSDD